MKLLVTGGFGNIGRVVVDDALRRGHAVTVFEADTPANRKRAKRWPGRVTPLFGDLRDLAAVKAAVQGQDAVIHLAAILPPASEREPQRTRDVNVGGTKNVVEAMREVAPAAPLVMTSSVSVMGPTQHRPPPVRVADAVNPTDNYSRSKVEAEEVVARSGVRFCTCRLAAVMVLAGENQAGMLPLMFEMPLDARVEAVVDADVATALLNAAELLVAGDTIDGKTFFIGGGAANGSQLTARDMVKGMLEPLGLRLPADRCFSTERNNFYVDWYDTEEAQRLLRFQNTPFPAFRERLAQRSRFMRPALRLFGPLIGLALARRSPYGK